MISSQTFQHHVGRREAETCSITSLWSKLAGIGFIPTVLNVLRLLTGQTLKDAQEWAEGKRLSNHNHQFLSASQMLEQQEQQKTWS